MSAFLLACVVYLTSALPFSAGGILWPSVTGALRLCLSVLREASQLLA